MYFEWFLAFIFLVFEPTYGGHFYGGTIRWMPITKNATTSPIQVMITQTYTYTLSQVNCTVGSLVNLKNAYGFNFSLWCTLNCGATSAGYNAPPILTYCTGSNVALDTAFTQRTDIVNLTANDYFSISYGIPNNASKGYYRPLALSSGGNDTGSQWNITTSIDIRPRPDNGLINTPPLANIMSPYGIPYNIPTQIVISTVDIDGDDVRCRWSNSTLECGDVCFPQTTPVSATLSSDCILTITGLKVNDWYCVPIQVEDFLNKSTSVPFSSVPVQFLIHVYQPKNCSIPTLSSPLSCIGVQVGIPYTFTLTAINQCGSSSNISDIVLQVFNGIVKGSLIQITSNSNTTISAMNVTYTPLLSQIGLQTICATALDNNNIPSNQYCITFIVDSTTVPVCPASTPTTPSLTSASDLWTTDAETTSVDNLSITLISSSKPNMITSMESILTSQSDITSQNINITSSLPVSNTSLLTTSATTSSRSKPQPINWPLIGGLAALMTLLILLSCYCCYRCLWGSASHRRHQKTNHGRRWPSINEDINDLTKTCRPRNAYQVDHADTDRTSNLQLTKFPPSTNSSVIRSTLETGQQSRALFPSMKNNLPNSSITTVDINQLSSDTEHQPTVSRISRNELPKEVKHDIPSPRSFGRSASLTQNTPTNSSKTTVNINQLQPHKEHQPTVSHISRNELPKEVKHNISSHRSTPLSQNAPTNSSENKVNINRLSSYTEHQPTVSRISRNELPKEAEHDISPHRLTRRSASLSQNAPTNSSENTVRITRVSSNTTKSTMNNLSLTNKMKHYRRYNSVNVTRITDMK